MSCSMMHGFNYSQSSGDHCDGGHNLMHDVQLGRSGKFLIANYATALTGMVILILGVYGFLLLLLTPFTVIGAALYILAGCVLVFWTLKTQLKSHLPPKMRWLLFDASPMELILHSKTAWKVYGLVLATMAMGKHELKDYIHADSTLLSSLLPSKSLQNKETFIEPQYYDEPSVEGMERHIENGEVSELANYNEHRQYFHNTSDGRSLNNKTLSSFGKRMANEIIDITIESVQRKLKKYFKNKMDSICHSMVMEFRNSCGMMHNLSWTMIVDYSLTIQKQMISRYLKWTFQQFRFGYQEISSSRVLRCLYIPCAINTVSIFSPKRVVERNHVTDATDRGNQSIRSQSCSQLRTVVEKCEEKLCFKHGDKSAFERIELKLSKSELRCLSQLGTALHDVLRPSCSSYTMQQQFLQAIYLSLGLTNIVALQMATIPSTYKWLGQIYLEKLLQNPNFGK